MMQNPLKTIALVFIPLLALAVGWQIGTQFERNRLLEDRQKLEMMLGIESGSGQIITDPEREVNIDVLWTTWRLLLSKYIDPAALQSDTMLQGAVSGMVEAVGDPYTVFMPPQENEDFRDSLSGHLQGIGAELAQRDGDIVIVAPLKGSPAERAGLMPEDVITQVDDYVTENHTLQEVVTRIRGAEGTQVKLLVARSGKPDLLTFTIMREDIRVPSTEFTLKETQSGSIGIIGVNQFGAETTGEVQEIINQNVIGKDLKGIIIDLRFNGGGYLEGAVDLSSMFIKNGKVVIVERRDGPSQTHDVTGRVLVPELPLVVLINQGSASASEIFAGAIKDNKRGKIIGMQSFGKGTVQEVIDLPGGSSLRVTIAKWKTPNGTDIGKHGITPDIAVDRTQADFDAKRDPQVDAALEWLLDKEDISRSAPSSARYDTR